MRQVYFCKTGKSVSHLCQNVTKRGLLVNYRLLRKVDEMCSCNQDLTVVVIIVVMIFLCSCFVRKSGLLQNCPAVTCITVSPSQMAEEASHTAPVYIGSVSYIKV